MEKTKYSINSPIIKNMLSIAFNCLFIYSFCSLGQTGLIIQCIFPSEPLCGKKFKKKYCTFYVKLASLKS